MKSHNLYKLKEKIYRKLKLFKNNWDIKSNFGQNMCPAMRKFKV